MLGVLRCSPVASRYVLSDGVPIEPKVLVSSALDLLDEGRRSGTLVQVLRLGISLVRWSAEQVLQVGAAAV